MGVKEKLFNKKMNHIKKSLLKKGRSETDTTTIIHAIQYLYYQHLVYDNVDFWASDYDQCYISPEKSVMIIGNLWGDTKINFEIYANDKIEKRSFRGNNLSVQELHPARRFSEVDRELTRAEVTNAKEK